MSVVVGLLVFAAAMYAASFVIEHYERKLRPACGPTGCWCRGPCSWLVGVSPEDWKRGVRAREDVA